MNWLIIAGILIGTILVLFLLARAKMKNIPLVENHEKILVLNEKNFEHQIKNRTVLVDFWAEWCAPCRMMAPVLNEMAAGLNDNKRIGKMDIEKYQSFAKKYNIRSIPTLILFKNGKEVNRFVGVKSKDFLIHQMNKN